VIVALDRLEKLEKVKEAAEIMAACPYTDEEPFKTVWYQHLKYLDKALAACEEIRALSPEKKEEGQ